MSKDIKSFADTDAIKNFMASMAGVNKTSPSSEQLASDPNADAPTEPKAAPVEPAIPAPSPEPVPTPFLSDNLFDDGLSPSDSAPVPSNTPSVDHEHLKRLEAENARLRAIEEENKKLREEADKVRELQAKIESFNVKNDTQKILANLSKEELAVLGADETTAESLVGAVAQIARSVKSETELEIQELKNRLSELDKRHSVTLQDSVKQQRDKFTQEVIARIPDIGSVYQSSAFAEFLKKSPIEGLESYGSALNRVKSSYNVNAFTEIVNAFKKTQATTGVPSASNYAAPTFVAVSGQAIPGATPPSADAERSKLIADYKLMLTGKR